MPVIAPAKASQDAKYDVLKFILSLFVVAIHSNLLPLVLYPWLRFAVPLFFLMSSYFLFSRLNQAAPGKAAGILKGYALRNAKLYCFWFLVLLPVTLWRQREIYLAPRGPLYLLRDLFFGSTFAASWYIAASVIGVYLVWFLCKKLGNAPVLVLVLVCFCLLTLWSSYPGVLQRSRILSGLLRRYIDAFGDPLWSFPAALVWVFAGKCFADGKIPLSSRWTVPLLVVSSCGLYLEWIFVRQLNGSISNDSYFLLLPACLLAFAWLQGQPFLSLACGAYLRRASTVVYTVHYSAIHVIRELILLPRGIDSAPAAFCLSLTISLLIWGALEGMVYTAGSNRLTKLLRWAF